MKQSSLAEKPVAFRNVCGESGGKGSKKFRAAHKATRALVEARSLICLDRSSGLVVSFQSPAIIKGSFGRVDDKRLKKDVRALGSLGA
jgi:hypothetical protein